jgi:hypothetical protein
MAGLLARGSLPIADLPGNAQWSVMATGSPLTVAGAATASAPVRVVLTVFPINPLDFVRRGTIAFTLSGRLAPVNEAKIPVVSQFEFRLRMEGGGQVDVPRMTPLRTKRTLGRRLVSTRSGPSLLLSHCPHLDLQVTGPDAAITFQALLAERQMARAHSTFVVHL